MQIIPIYHNHPTLCTIYVVVVVISYLWFVILLGRYIKYSGLDYKSGLYAHMTAQQQRWEWRKKKISLWIGGVLIALPLMAIFWPLSIIYAIRSKK